MLREYLLDIFTFSQIINPIFLLDLNQITNILRKICCNLGYNMIMFEQNRHLCKLFILIIFGK